ncbi:MAG: 4Fe-4S dicluster domain-containing protein [candidate division Zixibacteria bacterium]
MNSCFIVRPELCTGCRTCELACSFAHGSNGKQGHSRIVILDGGAPDLHIPITCLQCDQAACAKSCLVDAITRNPQTGAMQIDDEKCVRCMACIAACPFGCAMLDIEQNQPVKCDLCIGDPVCAKFCPSKALEYKPVRSENVRKVI